MRRFGKLHSKLGTLLYMCRACETECLITTRLRSLFNNPNRIFIHSFGYLLGSGHEIQFIDHTHLHGDYVVRQALTARL